MKEIISDIMQEFYKDEFIIDSLNRAIDSWVTGGGSESNFVTTLYNEAKEYYHMPRSEWRGAMLLYLLSGCGVRLTKEIAINIKLMMLDCLAVWNEHINKEGQAGWEKMKLLTYINELKDYTLKTWGMGIPWCRETMNFYVVKRLKEKFWISLLGKVGV